VDGRVVYEDGALTQVDQDEILAAGRDAAAEWLRRNRPLIESSPLAVRIAERAYGRT
jgi:hypothetical protein